MSHTDHHENSIISLIANFSKSKICSNYNNNCSGKTTTTTAAVTTTTAAVTTTTAVTTIQLNEIKSL